MTPVEARNTSRGRHPTACETSDAETLVASRPFLPVNALALPEFTSSARAVPPASAALHQSTAADGQRERVNTPPTVVPLSNSASRTSVRFW